MDQFYSGLENNDENNNENIKNDGADLEKNGLHNIGWERGFLDDFYKKFQATLERRMKSASLQNQRKQKDKDDDRHRRRNETNYRRSPSYDRGRSPRRRSRYYRYYI